jgi:hypothetical protein
MSARFVSISASALLTALLAFVNPIAAVAFAVHSIQIQYASQAYLEAVPALTIAVTMVAFERARTFGARWLIVSAVCLGLTAASKYIYAIAGFAILPFLLWRYRRSPELVLLYGIVTLVVFFVADPFLWTDPVGNFLDSLLFHNRVRGSELVTGYARPAWWHLTYLSRLWDFQPGIPYFSLDTLIFVGGVLGLPALWRHSRVYFVWFVVALVFLLLWNTKWEQYALTLITPLCLSFGLGTTAAARRWFLRQKKPFLPLGERVLDGNAPRQVSPTAQSERGGLRSLLRTNISCIPFGALFRIAFLRLEIYIDNSEPLAVPPSPLEIVQEGPDKVSA